MTRAVSSKTKTLGISTFWKFNFFTYNRWRLAIIDIFCYAESYYYKNHLEAKSVFPTNFSFFNFTFIAKLFPFKADFFLNKRKRKKRKHKRIKWKVKQMQFLERRRRVNWLMKYRIIDTNSSYYFKKVRKKRYIHFRGSKLKRFDYGRRYKIYDFVRNNYIRVIIPGKLLKKHLKFLKRDTPKAYIGKWSIIKNIKKFYPYKFKRVLTVQQLLKPTNVELLIFNKIRKFWFLKKPPLKLFFRQDKHKGLFKYLKLQSLINIWKTNKFTLDILGVLNNNLLKLIILCKNISKYSNFKLSFYQLNYFKVLFRFYFKNLRKYLSYKVLKRVWFYLSNNKSKKSGISYIFKKKNKKKMVRLNVLSYNYISFFFLRYFKYILSIKNFNFDISLIKNNFTKLFLIISYLFCSFKIFFNFKFVLYFFLVILISFFNFFVKFFKFFFKFFFFFTFFQLSWVKHLFVFLKRIIIKNSFYMTFFKDSTSLINSFGFNNFYKSNMYSLTLMFLKNKFNYVVKLNSLKNRNIFLCHKSVNITFKKTFKKTLEGQLFFLQSLNFFTSSKYAISVPLRLKHCKWLYFLSKNFSYNWFRSWFDRATWRLQGRWWVRNARWLNLYTIYTAIFFKEPSFLLNYLFRRLNRRVFGHRWVVFHITRMFRFFLRNNVGTLRGFKVMLKGKVDSKIRKKRYIWKIGEFTYSILTLPTYYAFGECQTRLGTVSIRIWYM